MDLLCPRSCQDCIYAMLSNHIEAQHQLKNQIQHQWNYQYTVLICGAIYSGQWILTAYTELTATR